MDENQKLAAEYTEAGVELLPETAPVEEPKVEEPKPESTPETPVAEPKPEEPTELLQTEPDAKPAKRPVYSVYDDLKGKRKEVKTERELRESAERERDELKAKLDAVSTATTQAERSDAVDDLEAFAKENDVDPAYLRKMQQVFLKGLPQATVDTEALERFKEWEKNNSQAIESQSFEKEFHSTLPTLKTMFPDASADEVSLIRTKLDELAHTDQYHDKELDYVIYKNQDSIKALISPKKRGIESKGRVDATAPTFDFDPNADISKMSDKEVAEWEKAYSQMGKTSELSMDSQGKRIFI